MADSQPSKPRVLIVDDAPDVAMTMVLLLKTFGYEAAQAHNGHSAIETARQQQPGVVFLDIGLPDMNGYEVAERLRSEAGLGKSVLIALSGLDQDEDRLAASAFDRHLVKPVTIQALKQVLAELSVNGSPEPRRS